MYPSVKTCSYKSTRRQIFIKNISCYSTLAIIKRDAEDHCHQDGGISCSWLCFLSQEENTNYWRKRHHWENFRGETEGPASQRSWKTALEGHEKQAHTDHISPSPDQPAPWGEVSPGPSVLPLGKENTGGTTSLSSKPCGLLWRISFSDLAP